MRIWQTVRIVVLACPVKVTLKPPLVVSAVTAIVHVAAPTSAYMDVTVTPTSVVDAALAPRLITPSIVQPLVLPPPVTPDITSPVKK